MTNPFLFDPGPAARFSAEKAVKVEVLRGERLFLGLNCFEPGQSQPVHAHRGADKFYLILSGKARMLVGGHRFDAGAGQLVWAPAEVLHGVEEAVERTVMLIGLTPPPSDRQLAGPADTEKPGAP